MDQPAFPAQQLYEILKQEFRPWECTEVFPINGLQFDCTHVIRTVYTATFAGDEVFEQMEKENASECLLFTHHPVPQRADPAMKAPPISQRWIDWMKERRVSLFSYHIPLDRNGPYSPGNRLAQAIGATPYGEFYEQNQVRMGVLCHFPSESLDELCAAIERAVGHRIACYRYGGDTLFGGRFAIMAGGAKNHEIYRMLREQDVHAFLTGVTNERVDWVAKNHKHARENGVNLIGATHCSTEKFAVIAMTDFFKKLGIAARFLPEHSNLDEL